MIWDMTATTAHQAQRLCYTECSLKTLRTFSIVEAVRPDVPNILDSEFTDVSPSLVGSTALNDSWYIGGTIASANRTHSPNQLPCYAIQGIRCAPMTELNNVVEPEPAELTGRVGGEGLGAALHGSSPSSYTDAESGSLSSTKLAPKFPRFERACVGRGALNMWVDR